jgi:polyisoprenyl-phosphate glycosyltransferase
MEQCLLSIIIPCYNEEAILRESISTLEKNLFVITSDYEIILIDDGSRDETFAMIKELARQNSKMAGIRLTRNFGKEAAMHAGLDSSKGRAVVIMDADLQHPPELLGTMFKHWKDDGYDVVEAVKSYKNKNNLFSKISSWLFNTLMSKFTGLNMQGASDYKLMDRKVVEQLLALPEKNRFFRGLVSWTGYRTKQVMFDVQERIGGETKWSFLSLLKLSASAATAFSSIPLQLVTGLGVVTLLFSFALGIQTLYNKLSGHAVSGFATVIILNLLLSSIMMISLGIIGIYVANIYLESKNRPFYIISESTGKNDSTL